MTNLLVLFITGLVMGLRHALDADHVAAVSTIAVASSDWKRASVIGGIWGIGHTITLLGVGLLVLIFKVAVPSGLTEKFELAVGVVLILLGLDLMRKMTKDEIHIHTHTHDGNSHTHFHSHLTVDDHRHYHRPFAVGALHGLAGSAVLLVFILSTVQSIWSGLAFLGVFSIGLIGGMFLVSGVIGVVFERFGKVNRIIYTLTGSVSIVIGLTALIQKL